MKHTFLIALLLASLTVIYSADTPAPIPAGRCFVPKVVGDFVLIYKPQPDVYSGPSTAHYTNGVTYSNWRPNDHTFIKGHDGRWHCFGITKPHGAPGAAQHHEAEGVAFHAVAPVGSFAAVAFKPHVWSDWPKITVGDCGWAPFILKIGREYTIIGSHLGRSTSLDLNTWTDRGKLPIKGYGRDPNVLYCNKTYYLYRCATNGVSLATSADFTTWSDPVIIFKPAIATHQTESPSVIPYAGRFYLFWCLWDRTDPSICDHGAQPGYCARTYVYCSDKPDDFRNAPLVARLRAHAPEIFQDEQGQWYISSADWPQRGVSVAPLAWEQ